MSAASLRSRLSAYMITGSGGDDDVVRQVERALELGVDFVQLRRRRASALRLEGLARRLAALAPDASKKILVNDRLDIALSLGFAGVHLPVEGLPAAAVRRFAPAGFLIACSTHDREQAVRAAREGANFVVFGPIFATNSKPGHPGVGVAELASLVRSVPIPVYALGGVAPESVALVARSGAAGVAGISVFEREESLRALMARLESAADEADP